MKKKAFSYISLASLIVTSFLTPIVNVRADDQQESLEQTISEDSEKMNKANITLDSSRTSERSSDSSTEDKNESTEETITENSTNGAEYYGETHGNNQVKNETTGQASEDQSEVAMANGKEDLATWMPDPTLQSVVAKSLGIEVSEITKEQMNKLQTLYIYAADSAIADLKGLEFAMNLSSFYMSGQNQITDFSVLKSLNNLAYVYLMGANVTDDNVPNFGDNVTRLNLSSASVTDAVFSKIVNMKGLESLSFESNMNITTIAPLTALPNLTELRIQTCGVTDFTVINDFPKLSSLAAYGQNTGRNDAVTSLSAKELNYDPNNQSFFVPFSIMPNRLTNFDGYQPPFTTSNSTSQTYFDSNGVQIPSSRLTITEDGITVSGVTQSEFENIETMEYNAFYNNPAGSYAQPDGYSFYAISSGTYLHQFSINHQEAAADVTVNYIDTDGNELKPSQKISGNIGESFDATTPNYRLEIEGYTLKEVRGNPTGKFTDQPQTVTYVYVKNPVKAAEVTTKYVDTEGNKISDEVVKTGNIGDDYTTEQKAIDGYTFKEVRGNPTGKFTDQPQTVTYVYVKNPVKAAEVTTKYVDTEGNKISDEVVKTGNIGDDYTTEQKAIDGYTFKEVRGNPTGKFTDQPQTVTYVYVKNPVKAAEVTTKYVDTEGNKISDEVVKTGNIGDDYTTEQKAIDGYTFKEVQGNPTGKFTDQPQTVTYVYMKYKIYPASKADNKLDHKDKTNNKETYSLSQHTLPKTGENKRLALISTGIGSVFLVLVLITSVLRFQKSRNSHHK
ncbi:MucBP domain-containing protein [Enterococcus faecalis]|uniref:MucBP domain-containing protein n=2 Tax=Enterococcus faecalis TaxID=1351 RepID=UPI0026DAC8B7|nr:MucBP domain-containing protein [Enterococcus faecalis]NVJ44333.1 putative internalin-J precursor InlJ [Enterococcus faecalis]